MRAHQALDRGLVIAVAAAAIFAAATDGVFAAWLLLGTAAAIFVLETTTHWSRPSAPAEARGLDAPVALR